MRRGFLAYAAAKPLMRCVIAALETHSFAYAYGRSFGHFIFLCARELDVDTGCGCRHGIRVSPNIRSSWHSVLTLAHISRYLFKLVTGVRGAAV